VTEGLPTKEELLERYGLLELKIQGEMRDHLDNKTGLFLGFALVAVVEILAFLLLAAAERPVGQVALLGPHRTYLLVFTLSGFLCVLISALCCVIQLWPMEYHYVDTDYLERIQPEATANEIQRRLLSYISECAANNDDVNDRKSGLAIAAAVSATLSVMFFSISGVIALFLVLH
jgi:hypothetical protein